MAGKIKQLDKLALGYVFDNTNILLRMIEYLNGRTDT